MIVGVSFKSVFCDAVLCVFSSSEEDKAACSTTITFFLSCAGVILFSSIVGRSVVYDCGIF